MNIEELKQKIADALRPIVKKYNNEPMEVEPLDMVAETWEGYGLSKEAAESSAESMKEYSRGEYVVCHNKEELEDFLNSL